MDIFTKTKIMIISKQKKEQLNRMRQGLYHFLDNSIKRILNYSISEEESSSETVISSSFASQKVVHSVKNLKKKVIITLNNGFMNVKIIVYHNSNRDLSELIKKIVAYTQYIISFSDLQKVIEINIYLTGLKKTKSSSIPTKDSVNSGSCLNNDDFSRINIWRKEELQSLL